MSQNVINAASATFEQEVLQSDKPVLVDFWASWCGPCRMMGPVVEQIADEKAGEVKVVKVNVDDNPELAQEYRVMSIPAFFVFKGGKVANQAVGGRPKAQLEALLV